MKSMFQECNELISLDLSNFNTSKVTEMECMFKDCKELKDLNILNFNIQENCNIKNIVKSIANDCNIKANSKTFKMIFN